MRIIFDTSVLSCFARAGLLDQLEVLTHGHERFVPRAVLDEIAVGATHYPNLAMVATCSRLMPIPVDGLPELRAFSHYARRLVSGQHNVGEAAVLAWAEVNGALALLDDRTAVQCGRERSVAIRGTLGLIAEGIRHGLLGEDDTEALIRRLVDVGGARLPSEAAEEFVAWARRNDLL